MSNYKIIIATGGTGGHLFPAEHLAKQLNEKKMQVIFAGSEGKFSKANRNNFFSISSSPIRKKNLPIAIIKIFYGIFQSIKLIKKFKPSLVVGFGSFYCFPVLLTAKFLRIPYVIYEPNLICGVVNRFFSKSALALAVQFEETENHKSKNVVTTPFLPWKKIKSVQRNQVKSQLNLKQNQFTLLIFGGSQGALFINSLILKIANELKNRKIQLIHVTGNDKITTQAKLKYAKLGIISQVFSFVEDIPFFCYGADLAICRSGAATIGDLIQTHTPSILIPYPFATENHQYKNAKFLRDNVKGGTLCLQKDLTGKKLTCIIDELRQNNCAKLRIMQENLKIFYEIKNQGRIDLANVIEDICQKTTTS